MNIAEYTNNRFWQCVISLNSKSLYFPFVTGTYNTCSVSPSSHCGHKTRYSSNKYSSSSLIRDCPCKNWQNLQKPPLSRHPQFSGQRRTDVEKIQKVESGRKGAETSHSNNDEELMRGWLSEATNWKGRKKANKAILGRLKNNAKISSLRMLVMWTCAGLMHRGAESPSWQVP